MSNIVNNPTANTTQATLQLQRTPLFKGNFAASGLERLLSQTGDVIYHQIPNSLDEFAKTASQRIAVEGESGLMPWLRNTASSFVKGAVGVVKQASNHDYDKFVNVGKLRLAEPPIGAMMLNLYPFTVGFRALRAIQRFDTTQDPVNGKKMIDYRELRDVLVRDLTVVTIFIWGMSRINKFLSGITQNLRNIQIKVPEGVADKDGVIDYAKMADNYYLANADTMVGLLRSDSKNGKGMRTAFAELSDQGLKQLHDKPQVANLLEKLQAGLDDMHHAFRTAARSNPATAHADEAVNTAAKHVDDLLGQLNLQRSSLLQDASEEVVKLAKRLPEDFREVLVKYGHNNRLPTDMLSFAFLVVCLGWLPVKLNDLLSQKDYENFEGRIEIAKKSKPLPSETATSVISGLQSGRFDPEGNPFPRATTLNFTQAPSANQA